jgi:hypothetical protein
MVFKIKNIEYVTFWPDSDHTRPVIKSKVRLLNENREMHLHHKAMRKQRGSLSNDHMPSSELPLIHKTCDMQSSSLSFLTYTRRTEFSSLNSNSGMLHCLQLIEAFSTSVQRDWAEELLAGDCIMYLFHPLWSIGWDSSWRTHVVQLLHPELR